jgi:hypothetical protein
VKLYKITYIPENMIDEKKIQIYAYNIEDAIIMCKKFYCSVNNIVKVEFNKDL